MLGHVTSITHKNNLILSNIDPGGGGGGAQVEGRRKVVAFPTFSSMIVGTLAVIDCFVVFVLAENNSSPLA